MRKMLLGMLVGVMFMVAGCGSDDAVDQGKLAGRTFISTDVKGRTLTVGHSIKMEFGDEGVLIDAGCNEIVGDLEFLGQVMRFKKDIMSPSSTMMSCLRERDAQDTWIEDLISDGVNASLSGDTLTLSRGVTTITLADQELYSKPPIERTKWTLRTSYTEYGEGFKAGLKTLKSKIEIPVTSSSPAIEFQRKGHNMLLFSGCNRGGSEYYLRKGMKTITVGPVFLTKAACPGKAGRVEAHLVRFLNGIVDYGWEGPALRLTRGREVLLFSTS